LSLQKRKY